MERLFQVLFGFTGGESREFDVHAPDAPTAVVETAAQLGEDYGRVTHILVRPNPYVRKVTAKRQAGGTRPVADA